MRNATWLVACGLVMISSRASAQSEHPPDRGRGYQYVFDDDPLAAGILDGTTAQIRVTPQPKRSILARPRVEFVTELLRSVEAL
jgi:hypothetical protein